MRSIRKSISRLGGKPGKSCRNPRPLITRERAAATIFGGIGVYHFGSGIYIRTVVRKYFIRVKYHAFIILNTWEDHKFQVHTFL
ncbi:hypothetical protein HanRHA438_Chr15g0730481 [Helianthus annuus]|nr:hypothetical protein HanRHA438_Chr15g0730481 [Helianthus annuus]